MRSTYIVNSQLPFLPTELLALISKELHSGIEGALPLRRKPPKAI